jgi:hypothetical protein
VSLGGASRNYSSPQVHGFILKLWHVLALPSYCRDSRPIPTGRCRVASSSKTEPVIFQGSRCRKALPHQSKFVYPVPCPIVQTLVLNVLQTACNPSLSPGCSRQAHYRQNVEVSCCFPGALLTLRARCSLAAVFPFLPILVTKRLRSPNYLLNELSIPLNPCFFVLILVAPSLPSLRLFVIPTSDLKPPCQVL